MILLGDCNATCKATFLCAVTHLRVNAFQKCVASKEVKWPRIIGDSTSASSSSHLFHIGIQQMESS